MTSQPSRPGLAFFIARQLPAKRTGAAQEINNPFVRAGAVNLSEGRLLRLEG